MSLASLTLYASYGGVHPDHGRLIDTLNSVGLIGGNCGPQQFLAGKRFFDHITFLGCSPRLALSPGDSENFLRITIPHLHIPRLYAGSNARAPLCPSCNTPVASWREKLSQSETGRIGCENCSRKTAINELNFSKRACYTQSIIQIAPVFESEAVPASPLLDTLSDTFSVQFNYAYI